MGVSGLLFCYSWEPFQDPDSEQARALEEARLERNERCYTALRYLIAGVVIATLFLGFGSIVSIYINSYDEPVQDWPFDSFANRSLHQGKDDFDIFAEPLAESPRFKHNQREVPFGPSVQHQQVGGGPPLPYRGTVNRRPPQDPLDQPIQGRDAIGERPPSSYRQPSIPPQQSQGPWLNSPVAGQRLPVQQQQSNSWIPPPTSRPTPSPQRAYWSGPAYSPAPVPTPATIVAPPPPAPQTISQSNLPGLYTSVNNGTIGNTDVGDDKIRSGRSALSGENPETRSNLSDHVKPTGPYYQQGTRPGITTSPPAYPTVTSKYTPSARYHDNQSFSAGSKNKASTCGFMCGDLKTCVDAHCRCDGHVQCPDSSDEIGCNCTSRLVKSRLCDGVPDCPKSEDEDWGCGGCSPDEFSCKEPGAGNMAYNKKECVTKAALCDGKRDCSDGKDEQNCFRLYSINKETRGVLSKGLLQKMIRGNWYYICKKYESSTFLETLGNKICKGIIGDLQGALPKVTATYATSEDYLDLDYAFTASTDAGYTISRTGCPTRQLIKVECPPPPCGYPLSKYKDQESRGRTIRSIDVATDVPSANATIRQKRNRYYEEDHLTSKVVGGSESEFGQWPFMCALYRNGKFICGASIIDEKWVVTAAHCTHGYEGYVYEIQCGMTRRYSYSYTEQSRLVIGVYPHERYNKQIFSNDIALMELESTLHLSKYVAKACPSFSLDMDPKMEEMCHVIGWGNLQEDGSTPDHLQEARLPVKECNEAFTRSSIQICAGYEEGKIDACQGDSGGPFVCPDDYGRYVLVGLVSFGRGCARPGKLGVYTRVSAYSHWMDSIMYGTNTFHKKSTTSTAAAPEKSCYRSGGRHLFDRFTCDRTVDCINAEDEMNCVYPDSSPEAYQIDYISQNTAPNGKHLTRGNDDCESNEFQCKTSERCIPMHSKCNGVRDCTDGSDEMSCSCAAVMETTAPHHMCDGMPDCSDLSDELDCNHCSSAEEEQVKCPVSNGTCIAASNWCDGYPHCANGEDEVDCIMLGKTKETPPPGFLTEKHARYLASGYVYLRNGGLDWTPACVEDFGTDVKDLVCPYLGLSEHPMARSFKRNVPTYTERRPGPIPSRDDEDAETPCTPLKVTCYEGGVCGERRLFTFSNDLTKLPPTVPGAYPWDAVVLVDGEKQCAAAIIDKKWAISPASCLQNQVSNLKDKYISVKTGAYPATTLKSGPMEQVKRINSIEKDNKGIAFLHTDRALNMDYFTSPLCYGTEGFPIEILSVSTCTAVKLQGNLTLQHTDVKVTSSGCPSGGDICAEVKGDCQSFSDAIIYCTIDAKLITAWYFIGITPHLTSTNCSRSTRKVNIIAPFIGPTASKYENMITGPVSQISSPPSCSGMRCPYGQCLDKSQICDRICDCSSCQDEEKCQHQYQVLRTIDDDGYGVSPSNGTDTCPDGYFRCESTYNCVPISAYCDGVYDCGTDDLTDEPDGKCDCKSYLTLISPDKVCDAQGSLDCPDRTDEQSCPCVSKYQLQCTIGNHLSCVHPNLICDGTPDCKYGEDEKECVALSPTLNAISENITSNQMSGFIVLRVKDKWHPYCSNDWTPELATTICQQEFGYKSLEKAPQLYDLDYIRQLQEEERNTEAEKRGETPQDFESPPILVLRKDADLQGPYDYKEDEEDYAYCYVAYITCNKD